MKRQIDVEIVLQEAPLIVIIFGQNTSDHNKQMITLT